MIARGFLARGVRPGYFIQEYLMKVTEDYPENIHRAYKDAVKQDWLMRHPTKKVFHGHLCTYASFNRYFHHLVSFGLLEMVRTATSTLQGQANIPALHTLTSVSKRAHAPAVNYYRLTAAGHNPHPAWNNPAGERIKRGSYV
jgi:hypothetical protein